ncbi:MAG: extensin family protein [Bauldia sp.]
MFRRVVYLAVVASILATLGGCALNVFGERREAWRNAEESACMSTRPFRRDEDITIARAINDHGVCGLEQPLIVAALLDGTLSFNGRATIGCPMAVTIEAWVTNAVQPAAIAWFGQPISGIRQMGGYNCRNVMNDPANELSEHAFGNAIDVSGFVLADGREISVRSDWSGGTREERLFLRDVTYTACQYFKTTLGPGYPQHDDHLHLDLAHHNEAGTRRYCNPDVDMPERPATAAPVFVAGPAPPGAIATPVVHAQVPVPVVVTGVPPRPAMPPDIGGMIDLLLR